MLRRGDDISFSTIFHGPNFIVEANDQRASSLAKAFSYKLRVCTAVGTCVLSPDLHTLCSLWTPRFVAALVWTSLAVIWPPAMYSVVLCMPRSARKATGGYTKWRGGRSGRHIHSCFCSCRYCTVRENQPIRQVADRAINPPTFPCRHGNAACVSMCGACFTRCPVFNYCCLWVAEARNSKVSPKVVEFDWYMCCGLSRAVCNDTVLSCLASFRSRAFLQSPKLDIQYSYPDQS